MTTARSKAGGPLGLTSSKAGLKKAGGKRGQKIDQAVRAIAATHEPSAPPRTYTDAELKLADGRPALDVDDAKYDALWADACRTMGGEPIHAEGTSRVEHILRVFDLNPAYGPCMGLTRLERWHRAQEIGESPPEPVRDILETREGVLDLRLSILDQTASLA
ncbi:Uncharacterized protein MSYG_1168 [Malassezia sympodialis ATCC 42132]|uniref:DNA polymerase delta subunit 4 n=1 Tax=Malassezia sympodialis (strain ATCC 42132) TaxID=1230383 RepID=A0A1M8A327_MALS4|nr:Uncharacterized protein MSYG_1168 [Malassezia sympodialis ATCC 42132]